MPSPPFPRLELRFLGEMQATLDGAPLAGKLYGKVLALLAFLAVESGRHHSREALADLLWPTLPAEAARANLRQALFHLRRALGGSDYVVVSRGAVTFAPDSSYWLDVRALLEPFPRCADCATVRSDVPCAACLEAMAQRASCYRGEFLAGASLEASAEFDDWCTAKREFLHREAVALMERLRSGYERRGEVEQALRYARRFSELQPWDEEGHRQLMRLLAENGQRAAALAQYEHCRAVLARELGLEPELATRVLATRIREGAFEAALTCQPVPVAPTGERRQATVLCCRFDIPELNDPDDIVERLHEPRQRCAELLRRHGGYVVPTPGGTVLAYFGYPVAVEDAALRAVRAALALAAEAAAGGSVRVGVHTGIIVTGADPALPDAAGVTSSAAQGLCERAEAGEVLVSDATGRLVDGFFRLQALESTPPVHRVTAETGTVDRLDVAPRLLPLIGRRDELGRLWRLWKEAKRGRGQMVLIRGEAGIGKSRLIRALRDNVSKEPCIIRELRCFPEYSQTPLYPIIAMLEMVFRLSPNDPPAVRFETMAAYLVQYYPAAADKALAVVAPLLGAAPDGAGPLPPAPKDVTLAVLLQLLEGLATHQPLLVIAEDIHWIDPTTREFLALQARRRMAAPILAVYSARPELQSADLHKESVLDLAPLSDADVARLVADVAVSLPAETVNRIVARADGVPLFAEEMARMASDPRAGEAPIPASLHYLLLARLDTLREARRVAQLAATLGREFDRELLAHIDGRSPAALDAALKALHDARLIAPTGTSGTEFQFRHALIQEAAYQSQTKAGRQAAHRRIAEALTIRRQLL